MRLHHPLSASQRHSKTRYFARSGRRSRKKIPLFRTLLLAIVLLIGYKQLQGLFLQPQAMLVLGGAPEREVFAAEFAREHPGLPIWVSSGSNPEYSEWVFEQAGVSPERVHLDYRAEDTVTNFTTLVGDFESQGIDSIYLITSEDHMRRARIIGEIVLGSRGIHIKSVSVPSKRSPESLDKAVRDAVRSVLWLTTGRTGVTLRHVLGSHR